MKIGDKLVDNSLYLFLDWIVVGLFSLLFWLIIGKTLPRYEYGIVATAISTATLLSSFAVFGLGSAVTKLISEYVRGKKSQQIKHLVGFSTKTTLATSAIVSVVLFLLAGFISNIYHTPILSLQIAAMVVIPLSLYTMSVGIMQGFQHMKKIFTTDSVGFVMKMILTFLLIVVGFSFAGPLIGWLISYLIILFMRYRYFNTGSTDSLDKKFVILSYAIPAFISTVVFTVLSGTPNLIISSIAGPATAALFAIALTINYPITIVPGILSSALFPIISGLMHEKNPKSKQSSLVSLVTHYTFFLSLPLIVLLVIFSRELVLFFSTANYLGATQLFPFLTPASFLFGIGSLASLSLYAIRKPKLSQYIAIVAMIFFLLLAIPLTFAESMQGTAIAYLSTSILFVVLGYWFLRRTLHNKFPYLSVLKILAASLVMSAICFYSLNFSLAIKIILALISILVYAITLIPLKFYTDYDLRILRILKKNSPYLGKIFELAERLISYNIKETDNRKNNL